MTKSKGSSTSLDPLFDKIGQLTILHRLLICIVAFILLVGCFVGFMYRPRMKEIDSLEKQKSSLQQQLATAQKKAARLEALRAEKKKAEEDFMLAKAVLPDTKEIPSLLSSISQSGQDAGLEFLLFQPKPEVLQDFYAEIPVDIKVTGNYHNVATFFDNVSRLYRIVNIDDIKMKSGGDDGTDISTSCTAVTYKYVETQVNKPEETTAATSRRTRRR
jgi:type IV pilus assembly protein PilO